MLLWDIGAICERADSFLAGFSPHLHTSSFSSLLALQSAAAGLLFKVRYFGVTLSCQLCMDNIRLGTLLSFNLEVLYFLKLCPIFVDQTLHSVLEQI